MFVTVGLPEVCRVYWGGALVSLHNVGRGERPDGGNRQRTAAGDPSFFRLHWEEETARRGDFRKREHLDGDDEEQTKTQPL